MKTCNERETNITLPAMTVTDLQENQTMTSTLTAIRIGPHDHGRHMSLTDFDEAEVEQGIQVELGRGIIIVSEVPLPWHFRIIIALRRQLAAYDLQHPGRIWGIAGGSDCKLPVAEYDSERHPDLAVYLTEPPYQDSNAVWSEWIPELVIEVVSSGSETRDYTEKRDEYLAFGVREYWIVHPDRKEILVLRRMKGLWSEQTLTTNDSYSPHRLPGFTLNIARVFE